MPAPPAVLVCCVGSLQVMLLLVMLALPARAGVVEVQAAVVVGDTGAAGRAGAG